MKIQTGDNVLVISGKDKGKNGRVVRVLAEKNRVVVEGINMRVRHIKKTQQGPGQRINYEASIHASNVMIVDPKTKKPTRVGYKIDEKTGKKQRVALASGEVITKAAAKAAAPKAKKADVKEAKETKDAKKEAPATKPTKQPFWKRGGGGPGAGDQNISEDKTGGSAAMPSAHRAQGG